MLLQNKRHWKEIKSLFWSYGLRPKYVRLSKNDRFTNVNQCFIFRPHNVYFGIINHHLYKVEVNQSNGVHGVVFKKEISRLEPASTSVPKGTCNVFLSDKLLSLSTIVRTILCTLLLHIIKILIVGCS